MRVLIVAIAFLAVCAVASTSQSSAHVYHPSWKMVADVADHKTHCFNIALKHTDAARKQLEELFWKVSDPKHSMYGQHLSHQQVTELMAVPEDDVKIVTDWLRAGGATDIQLTGNKDFLDVCMTVSQIEALFGVQMKHFEHVHTQEARPRADRAVSIPSHISDRVAYFGGIDTPMHSYRRPHRMAESEMPKVSTPGRVNAAPPVSVGQGNEEVTISFYVYCRNGQINTDPTIPCLSHPPAVTTFEIAVTQEGRSPTTFALYPADNVMCLPSAACTATLPVRNYLGTTVGVSVVFADGNSTDIPANTIPTFPQDFVTPQFLKKLYGIPDGLVCKSPQSTQSVAEFLNETYNPNDLKEWFSRMGLRDESNKVQVIGPNDNIGTGEATLDIQTIMGVAGNTSQVVFWSTPGLNERPGQEPFLIWLQQIASTPVVPFVHSISFGDTEKFLKQSYMSAVHVEFQKAGVRGISLLYSSGDYGVASSYNDTLANRCMQDNPEWPASSPYVTAVGATQLSTHTSRFCTQTYRGGPISCSTVREKMCDAASGGVITSGGGFSDVHARPSYQDGAVAKYLAQQGAYPGQAGWFNTNGRAYPDVAAYGTNFLLVMEGQIITLSGTSASAPTFAGVVTLLNDIRYINGQGPLGFLNPWLYSMYELHPDAFNDVTYGVNNCTVRADGCCPDGFHAVAGWDAVSGLGTPNFIVLGSVVANGANNPYPYFNPTVAGGSGGTCACTPHEDTTSRHLAIASICIAIFAIIITSGIAYKATRSSSGGRTGTGGESLLGSGY